MREGLVKCLTYPRMSKSETKRPPRKSTQGSFARLIRKLAENHGPTSVRAAMLRCWIRSNQIAAAPLRHCQQTQTFLESVDARNCEPLCSQIAVHGKLSIKDVESGLESLNETTKRRHQGIVYTPNDVIDYLLATAVREARPRKTAPVVCDPACGSGGFLLRAASLLSQQFEISIGEALRSHVVGIDRDRDSLDNARCLIELALAERDQNVPTEALKLVCRDSLTTPKRDLCRLAGVDDGFDIVASNPPYVKLQNLELPYRRELEDRYREFVKGSYSLALLFLIAGHRLLKDGGCLAYVTQNNLFTSLAGEPIRRFLDQRRCLRRILDFGPTKIFGNAGAYTCLIFLGTDRGDEVEYEFCNEQPTRRALRRLDYSPIPLTQLNSKKWRLAKPRHLENLRRIEHAGCPLGELADIHVGVATLKDSVFLVRDAGDKCLAVGPNGEDVEIERAITRPAVKVASIATEAELIRNRLRIIFPYYAGDRGFALIVEDELRDKFPLTFLHLEACRDLLRRRDKGQKKAEAWYSWGRSQGRQALGPKLLTKTFDRRPNFMLDQSDQLFCNGYSVTTRADAASWLSIEMLQSILNSPVMHYYAKLTSFQIAGGYQCYQKNFIERFGVPLLDRGEAEMLLSMDSDSRDEQILQRYGLPRTDIDEVLLR